MIKAGKLKRITPKQEAMSPDTSPARLAALAKVPDEAVQRAVAKNPRTPPKVLKKLGSSRDKYIRKAVAGNPNTPADIMSGLGGQFPMELLGNPALDLLLLENPDLFSEMPIVTLRSLAKRESCPEGLLVYMARAHHQGENLQRSFVQNPKTPRQVIEQIVKSSMLEEIKEEARLHVTLSSELTAEHAEALFWETIANQVNCSTPLHWQLLSDARAPQRVRTNIVARQVLWGTQGSDVLAIQENSLPIPVLESLAVNGRIKIRRAACFNSAAPEWLREARFMHQVHKGIEMRSKESFARLSELYGNGTPEFDIILAEHPLATDEMKGRRPLPEFRDEQLREKAASSPFAWAKLLWHLAEIGDFHSGLNTRGAIAANQKTPVTLLEKLADKKEYWWVKKRVANNPSTPAALLEKLASDKNDWVREIVASNPNTNQATLGLLAGDAEFDIRYRVAENLNTPASALERLAGDKGVSRFSWKLGIKEVVAKNPNTSSAVLSMLVGDNDDRVRTGAALNPNAPSSLREKFVDAGVNWFTMGAIREIAERRSTPAHVLEKALEKLACSESEDHKIFAAENLNTPVATLKKLLEDKNVSVRVAAAENPNIPAELLTKILESLARNVDSEVRRYIADNPNTPASVLEKLAKDKCEVVRWDVASNPNTTLSTLEILTCDTETRVRKTARATLRRRKSSIPTATK